MRKIEQQIYDGIISFKEKSPFPWSRPETFAKLDYTIHTEINPNCIYINELWVTSEFRRLGYAKKMIGELKNIARKESISIIEVRPCPYFPRIHKKYHKSWQNITCKELYNFYRSCGFHDKYDVFGDDQTEDVDTFILNV